MNKKLIALVALLSVGSAAQLMAIGALTQQEVQMKNQFLAAKRTAQSQNTIATWQQALNLLNNPTTQAGLRKSAYNSLIRAGRNQNDAKQISDYMPTHERNQINQTIQKLQQPQTQPGLGDMLYG